MIGILLINLGTPDAPTEIAVRNYLNEFLSDPYVITLPKFLRDFLVQKMILPTRPKRSANAYQQIWTGAGSPLLVNSMALKNALQEKLGAEFKVALGMRYGNPSLCSGIAELKNAACEKLIILPLFPQYSRAATQSAIDCAKRALQKLAYSPAMQVIQHFHQENFYIQSTAQFIVKTLAKNPTDFLLFSYHGLPKRQIDPHMDYQKQCLETSERIANDLQLPQEKYQTSFQSRLGLTKWITPYTDRIILDLRKKGIQRISVVCPSFVCDCLETLEEINIRLRKQWMALGGEQFEFIPCLNVNAQWVGAMSAWIANLAPYFSPHQP